MFDPVGESPCNKTEVPVSINLVDMSDLVVVKVKGIFEFLKTVFNTPTKQIVGNNHFGRGIEFVGNEDVVAIVVILIPLTQNDNKLDGNFTIFQLGLERIGFMGNFRAIRSFELNVFDFIAILLFDEGHELIWFDETILFLYGMAHEDVSVRFYFGIEDFAFLVNVGEEACCRIP